MKIPYNWLKDYVNTKLSPKEAAKVLTESYHALDKPLYEQGNDTIMDLEDRGNRADAVGIVGIALDLSALTKEEWKMPKLSEIPKTDNKKFPVKITIESDKVTRWRAIVVKNVKIKESPEWLKQRLTSYGIDIKNNLVDLTNYVMLELGMPLHAFDLDKVDEIRLRQAKKGEKLITFDGTELEFDESDLLAANSKKPLTLTTAVGGKESGVTETTTNTLIEAGLYHQPTVRKSALRLNVRNESSSRLGKYLHPIMCELAIARIITLLKEVMNVEPENISFDYYPTPYPEVHITLTSQRLNLLSGENIDLKEAKDILERLQFGVKKEEKDSITVEVPCPRTDITMEDDLIEEILRIRGYDKIPSKLLEKPAPKRLVFDYMELEKKIKETAIRLSFDEVISEQIVDRNELYEKENIVELENSWNKELNVLRPTLFSGLIKYLTSYKKHGISDILLFEIGKTFGVEGDKNKFESYKEYRKTGLTQNTNFYSLKSNVEQLLFEIGLKNIEYKKTNNSLFKSGVSAELQVRGKKIGIIGEVKNTILSGLGIEETVSFCELENLEITKLTSFEKETLDNVKTKVSNYISEDFTFLMDENEEVGSLLKEIKNLILDKTKIAFLGVYKSEKLKGKKSVTFNLKFENTDSTKKEIEKIKGLQNNYLP